MLSISENTIRLWAIILRMQMYIWLSLLSTEWRETTTRNRLMCNASINLRAVYIQWMQYKVSHLFQILTGADRSYKKNQPWTHHSETSTAPSHDLEALPCQPCHRNEGPKQLKQHTTINQFIIQNSNGWGTNSQIYTVFIWLRSGTLRVGAYLRWALIRVWVWSFLNFHHF